MRALRTLDTVSDLASLEYINEVHTYIYVYIRHTNKQTDRQTVMYCPIVKEVQETTYMGMTDRQTDRKVMCILSCSM